MKSYEKELKNLLRNNVESFCYDADASNKADLYLLGSLNLIKVTEFNDGSFDIEVLPYAAKYFEERRKEKMRFWIPIIISNLIAIAALVRTFFI